MELAKRLESLLKQKENEANEHYVITNNQGVVVGDENTVTINFSSESLQSKKGGK